MKKVVIYLVISFIYSTIALATLQVDLNKNKDLLTITINPNHKGFLNYVYIYSNNKLINTINFNCINNICYNSKVYTYDISKLKKGTYSILIYDYSIRDWVVIDFTVSKILLYSIDDIAENPYIIPIKNLKLKNRTLTSNIYETEDKNLLAEIFTKPINYKKNNQFFPINTSIKSNKLLKGYEYAVEENFYKTYFKNKGTYKINIANSEVEFNLRNSLNIIPETKGNSLLYRDILNNIDLIYKVRNHELKEYIVIKDQINITSFIFDINLKNTILKQENNSILAYNNNGNLLWYITPPFALANKEENTNKFLKKWLGNLSFESTSDEMIKELNILYDGGVLKLELDREWLGNVQYPVIIDPTIIINSPNMDGYVYLASGSYSNNQLSALANFGYESCCDINGQVDRIYLDFNTQDIPDNSLILDILFKPYIVNTYSQNVEIKKMDDKASNILSLGISNLFQEIGKNSDTNRYYYVGICCNVADRRTIQLDANAKSNLQNQLSADWFSLGMKVVDETYTGYGKIRTAETIYPAQLEVIYDQPPVVVADSFAVQDGPLPNWDDGSIGHDSTDGIIDTHDQTPAIQWNLFDPNPDSITTRICISSTINKTCDILDFTTAAGVTSYTISSGLNYSSTSVTYYVDLTPNDGLVNGATYQSSFNLVNFIPDLPSSLAPTLTHDQTPTLTWTATDADTVGTIDHWPADTLTYHILVGDTCGTSNYLTDPLASSPTATVANPVPWGTPGIPPSTADEARTGVCARVWTTDGHTDGISSNYDQTITLYDYLPLITNIEITDILPYSSCISSTCALTPYEGSTTSLLARVTFTDTDSDCALVTHSADLTLCLTTTGTCDEVTNNNYQSNFTTITPSGSTCIYELSLPVGSSTPEFYILPDTYKLHVNVFSQAGQRTSDLLNTQPWTYNSLLAIDYPASVTLGDTPIDLGIWNPGINTYLLTNWGNNILNLAWGATNPCTAACSATDEIWDLTGTDFMVDDDTSQSDDTGNLPFQYLYSIPVIFNRVGGLQICNDLICSGPANATLNTNFHIMPEIGLVPGVYTNTITIILS